MILDPEFHARYGPTAVVAGATEGIGRAFAHQLAEKGLDLVLLARRTELLEAEAHLLRRRHGVRVDAISLDLGAADLEQRFSVILEGRDVGLLVYNACYSKIGPFLETDLASKQATLDVNCRGPLVLTSLLAPRLVARGRGGLLLMSSMSGLQGTALVGTYAASKAFDNVFGEGLWAELRPLGVDVLVCVAGATSTPNFEAQTPRSQAQAGVPHVARGGSHRRPSQAGRRAHLLRGAPQPRARHRHAHALAPRCRGLHQQEHAQGVWLTSIPLVHAALVTGGCGYLGRALVQRLLSLGCEVHTLDLAEAAPDPRARHFRGDLRDFASIAPAFEGGADRVPLGGAHCHGGRALCAARAAPHGPTP
jgi:short-subunit dehydrogenase